MFYRFIILLTPLLLCTCTISEQLTNTSYLSLDGKRYVVESWQRTRSYNLDEETEYYDYVIIEGKKYRCEGDCSRTVERVLADAKKRKIILANDPTAPVSPTETPSH
ncbi:hypothetical protein QEZ52_15510 [Aliisedimentitalea scapharcae]|uniref:Lipoprotein n=1 Tax=Aliisedimentitalea scapharcae TaxID=1524259 RepID=A0ABZ2XPK3_9RHOB